MEKSTPENPGLEKPEDIAQVLKGWVQETDLSSVQAQVKKTAEVDAEQINQKRAEATTLDSMKMGDLRAMAKREDIRLPANATKNVARAEIKAVARDTNIGEQDNFMAPSAETLPLQAELTELKRRMLLLENELMATRGGKILQPVPEPQTGSVAEEPAVIPVPVPTVPPPATSFGSTIPNLTVSYGSLPDSFPPSPVEPTAPKPTVEPNSTNSLSEAAPKTAPQLASAELVTEQKVTADPVVFEKEPSTEDEAPEAGAVSMPTPTDQTPTTPPNAGVSSPSLTTQPEALSAPEAEGAPAIHTSTEFGDLERYRQNPQLLLNHEFVTEASNGLSRFKILRLNVGEKPFVTYKLIGAAEEVTPTTLLLDHFLHFVRQGNFKLQEPSPLETASHEQTVASSPEVPPTSESTPVTELPILDLTKDMMVQSAAPSEGAAERPILDLTPDMMVKDSLTAAPQDPSIRPAIPVDPAITAPATEPIDRVIMGRINDDVRETGEALKANRIITMAPREKRTGFLPRVASYFNAGSVQQKSAQQAELPAITLPTPAPEPTTAPEVTPAAVPTPAVEAHLGDETVGDDRLTEERLAEAWEERFAKTNESADARKQSWFARRAPFVLPAQKLDELKSSVMQKGLSVALGLFIAWNGASGNIQPKLEEPAPTLAAEASIPSAPEQPEAAPITPPETREESPIAFQPTAITARGYWGTIEDVVKNNPIAGIEQIYQRDYFVDALTKAYLQYVASSGQPVLDPAKIPAGTILHLEYFAEHPEIVNDILTKARNLTPEEVQNLLRERLKNERAAQ